MSRSMKALVAAAAIALATPALSQKPEPALPPEVPLAAADRDQLIDATLAALEKSYVFPEVATKMTEAIRARQEAGDEALERAKALALEALGRA